MNQITPFYVGQKVVAIYNHSQGAFKKGDVFTVTSVFSGCCEFKVTIGIPPSALTSRCNKCGYVEWSKGERIFSASRFAPVENFGEFVSMKQLVKEQLPLIGAN